MQLAASNARQHRRFYEAIGDPEEAKRASLQERHERHEEKMAEVAETMKERTADEWETYLQNQHVPAARVRELRKRSPIPTCSRGVLHRHDRRPASAKRSRCRSPRSSLPTTARRSNDRPPRVGEHTDEVLTAVGYSAEQVAALRRSGAIA